MKRVELHTKSKYGLDYDSVIDIEALLWNAKENGEKGIVIADKDTIIAFPKIEKIYNSLRLDDPSFKNFKIGYGVQITSIIKEIEMEIVILVKKQEGLKNLYKIMSLYNNTFKNKMPLDEIFKLREGLLVGIILTNTNTNIDLSLFDYIEINENLNISNIDKNNIVVFSNNPNSLFPGDIKALEVLYFRKKINKEQKCRLYLDTEDTLKICNDEKKVIINTNLIFDKLDNIVINDEKFHITRLDNFDKFKNLVKNSFQKKYKKTSLNDKERLDKELKLIKELDYTYYFEILIDITNYCKKYNNYYQLDGYINNSLVAYILDITDIDPFHLPYELFFSEVPNIVLRISPKFYEEKLYNYINHKFKNKLLKCSCGYKLSNITIPGLLKHYEYNTNTTLSLLEKDYIHNLLNQIIVNKYPKDNSYFIIPNNMEIEDFTPYEIEYEEKSSKYNSFDNIDLNNNLLRINFIMDKEIQFISKLRYITKTNILNCNYKNVYDLFRDTEPFNINFEILDRTTGLLNIKHFDTKEIARKLKRIPNLWYEDLIKILTKIENAIIVDDLYNTLNKRNFDDVAIFNVINSLKQLENKFISKAILINKVRISYMQMYYKLYFPQIYYQELLENLDITYVSNKIFSYNIEKLKKRYLNLNKKDSLWMTINEHQELGLLEILFEMYERKIDFKLKKRKVVLE